MSSMDRVIGHLSDKTRASIFVTISDSVKLIGHLSDKIIADLDFAKVSSGIVLNVRFGGLA